MRVSPSKVESFGNCGLRWLLGSVGGDGPSVGAADIGTLVHDIAAELGDVDADTLVAEVDARWGRLGMPAGWVSDRKRARGARHGPPAGDATSTRPGPAAGCGSGPSST